MILIDSNSLIILLLGLIDENLIGQHKRASIYTKEDFKNLVIAIQDFKKLIVLPQVWAEADNLLNNFSGNHKYQYISNLKHIIEQSTEKYLEIKSLLKNENLLAVGITDSLIIEIAKDCEYVITSDSKLSDLIIANGISVYDMVQVRNQSFQ
ncbi:hypothetical protein [Flavobacterium sp. UBA7663]|uniref:hypothetical protein n=1 Tax=Flavobacterium sp. UBA7663 TaxID=1946557 RepID=UPI0025C125DC|nr:hypothetical protein [Flavobacterium sp. UBA7663]